MNDRVYDLFITHAWRYHDDWTRLVDLLDQFLDQSWRNFSVPWYDPALDPNTEVGKRLVYRWLEQQIVASCGVILLSSVYENKSARKWVEIEVEMARKHDKRIIGVPAFGKTLMSPEAAGLVDAICPWDPAQLISALVC
jgi:antiphage defense system Thoeris ThsB-like protein